MFALLQIKVKVAKRSFSFIYNVIYNNKVSICSITITKINRLHKLTDCQCCHTCLCSNYINNTTVFQPHYVLAYYEGKHGKSTCTKAAPVTLTYLSNNIHTNNNNKMLVHYVSSSYIFLLSHLSVILMFCKYLVLNLAT